MSFQELLKQPSPRSFNTLFDLIPTASSIKCPLGLKLLSMKKSRYHS